VVRTSRNDGDLKASPDEVKDVAFASAAPSRRSSSVASKQQNKTQGLPGLFGGALFEMAAFAQTGLSTLKKRAQVV